MATTAQQRPLSPRQLTLRQGWMLAVLCCLLANSSAWAQPVEALVPMRDGTKLAIALHFHESLG